MNASPNRELLDRRRVDADQADRPGLGDALDRPLQNLRRPGARLPLRAGGRALGDQVLDRLLELGVIGLGCPVCVDADRVDHAIGADAARHLLDQLDWVLLLEVHDLGALPACRVQAVGYGVDGDHAAGAEVLALQIVNWPTEPQRKTQTVSPSLISAVSAA
jgi:hypothetical protein